MEKFALQTQSRELTHRNSKHLYREGLIPAEVYGHNTDNVHVAINEIEFIKLLRDAGESTIIELTLPDGSTKNVIVQNVQNHYLTTKPIHVDFFAVNMTEKLTTNVAIEFIGESEAVKALGGTLVTMLSEVEVECLPADLPSHFEVDIAALKTFDNVLTVADIPHSDKVEIKADPEEAVAKVQEPRDIEAELAEEEVSEEEAVAAVAGEEAEGSEDGEAPNEEPAAEEAQKES